jgi:hypothetical protein
MLAAYKWRGDERAGRTSTAGTHACTADYAQRLAVQRAQEKEHRSHAHHSSHTRVQIGEKAACFGDFFVKQTLG